MESIKINGADISGAYAAHWESDPIAVGGKSRLAIELLYTGAPAGTITVKGGLTVAGLQTLPDLEDDTAAAGDKTLIVDLTAGYEYVSVVWTRTSGTMTVTSAKISSWT